MAADTLDEVRRLVDQLTPVDQVRLLEYLTPKIAQTVAASQERAIDTAHARTDAWNALFRAGDELAGSDPGEGLTLTAAIVAMRR